MHVSLLAVICGGALSWNELLSSTQQPEQHAWQLGKQIVVPNLCADCISHACIEGEAALPCAMFCSASPAGKLLVPAAKIWVPAGKIWVPTGKLWFPCSDADRSSASAAMTASIADDCLLSFAEGPATAEARWLCSACDGLSPATNVHRSKFVLGSM